ALDVYLRILVAQHRAHHTDSSAATQLTDFDGHIGEHAQALAAADMDGGFQGRVTSHADFIREHRLVRHLLSPAPDHHHRLPSLFLIHPRPRAHLLLLPPLRHYHQAPYEFIPQVLFLASLFGYLSLLIIVKWVTASQADLYHVMIYMFLNPTEPLGENELFWGQGTLQIVLLLIALISVPWMLFPKPLILRAEHIKKRQGRAYAALNSDNELYEMEALHPGEEGQLHHHHHEEEFDFGEVMVHQMIHTIEFVLGAVSNTASYLRLWALSLAHAELSAVFFERVLLPAFESGNIIFIIIGFFVFASATVGVLLLMETLSAFLHALRLHWVEFMNKFYTGDG
ncbi:unnamed protein product, partial [Closterium sp. NIES-54]